MWSVIALWSQARARVSGAEVEPLGHGSKTSGQRLWSEGRLAYGHVVWTEGRSGGLSLALPLTFAKLDRSPHLSGPSAGCLNLKPMRGTGFDHFYDLFLRALRVPKFAMKPQAPCLDSTVELIVQSLC